LWDQAELGFVNKLTLELREISDEDFENEYTGNNY